MRKRDYLAEIRKLASSPTASNRSEARVIAHLSREAYLKGNVSLDDIRNAIQQGKQEAANGN